MIQAAKTSASNGKSSQKNASIFIKKQSRKCKQMPKPGEYNSNINYCRYSMKKPNVSKNLSVILLVSVISACSSAPKTEHVLVKQDCPKEQIPAHLVAPAAESNFTQRFEAIFSDSNETRNQ